MRSAVPILTVLLVVVVVGFGVALARQNQTPATPLAYTPQPKRFGAAATLITADAAEHAVTAQAGSAINPAGASAKLATFGRLPDLVNAVGGQRYDGDYPVWVVTLNSTTYYLDAYSGQVIGQAPSAP